jgi:hypothetical protein
MCLLAVNKNQLNKLSLKEVEIDLPKVDFVQKKVKVMKWIYIRKGKMMII